jgi:hypothetical protein
MFFLFLISVSLQFLGWLILTVILKIFESESRVDSLSECYDGQDVSLSMNGWTRSNSDKAIEVMCFRVSSCHCSRFPDITELWYSSIRLERSPHLMTPFSVMYMSFILFVVLLSLSGRVVVSSFV